MSKRPNLSIHLCPDWVQSPSKRSKTGHVSSTFKRNKSINKQPIQVLTVLHEKDIEWLKVKVKPPFFSLTWQQDFHEQFDFLSTNPPFFLRGIWVILVQHQKIQYWLQFVYAASCGFVVGEKVIMNLYGDIFLPITTHYIS